MKFKKTHRIVMRNCKKLLKIFLSICEVVSSEIFSYKKTVIGLCLIFVVVIIVFFGKDMITNTLSKNLVVSESEVLRKVELHVSLPKEPPVSIVRVKDAETLRGQHFFYKDIKEGDYIIMYPDKVYIYDLQADAVIGEKSSK